MEIKINRAALLKGLYLAQSIADRKNTNPSLANVLLRSEGKDAITCAATDLRTAMIAEIPAEVSQEGAMSIGAKHLYEIVRNLPADEVTLKKGDNNWVEISAGRARYKLVGISERDFPKLPEHREVSFSEFPAPVLTDMIAKTIFSVSTDETRHPLSGIFFECDGERATMVSTDGHRLSKVERTVRQGPKLANGVIIPRKGVLELRRLLEAVEEGCDIGFADGYVFVKARDVVLSVALVDAQFPSYRKVIPEKNDKHIELARVPFLESLKRVALMSSERSWGIRMELSKGRLRITSDNPDLGEAQEDIAISYDEEDITVGFNARYFIDIIGEISKDLVVLELSGDLDPGLLRPAETRDYIGVVMPMLI